MQCIRAESFEWSGALKWLANLANCLTNHACPFNTNCTSYKHLECQGHNIKCLIITTKLLFRYAANVCEYNF